MSGASKAGWKGSKGDRVSKATEAFGEVETNLLWLRTTGGGGGVCAGAKATCPCVHLRLALECQAEGGGEAGKGSEPRNDGIRQVLEEAPRGCRTAGESWV